MRILNLISTLALGIAVPSALAAPLCPAVGVATDCNIVLTVGADGSLASSAGASLRSTYDGSEDVIIGVLNNSDSPISSLSLSATGVPIFAFDGDGIDTFGIVKNPGNPDTTGYGGPNAYFTNVAPNYASGVVNFITPIAPGGGFDFFSLEEAITFTQIGGSTGPSAVPEPSTFLLLGTGIAGFVGSLRRRLSAQ
ncbi:PEP-CTERM sorting domain-containing protein [Edaphobacter sp. HDX4]|uniref:PEP-CTERM sorting domain-containing protein n=1 Tax=Edaphobacter sp. HDX4 TaxID=2794064 RepID=UPI002FE5129F